MKEYIKYIIRRLQTKKTDFEILEHQAKCYNDMIKCVACNTKNEYVDAKTPHGATIWRGLQSANHTIKIDLKKMLEAGGVYINDSVKWDIAYEANNISNDNKKQVE